MQTASDQNGTPALHNRASSNKPSFRKTLKLVTFLLFLLSTANSWAFFDMFKIIVFSPIQGVVLKDGKPQPNLTIERIADHYNDKVYRDETVTDENGFFKFGEISTRSFRPILFDTVVLQEINIMNNGHKTRAWKAYKTNDHSLGEVSHNKNSTETFISCECELSDNPESETIIDMDGLKQVVLGVCQIKPSGDIIIKERK